MQQRGGGFEGGGGGERARARERELLNTKCAYDFLYKICLKHFSFQEEMSEI